MNKKLLYLTVVVLLVLLGTTSAMAAPKPNVWDTIADLQASVSALWTNATAQQSEIQVLQDQPSVHFGNWSEGPPYELGQIYPADTDGFVVIQVWTTSDSFWRIYAQTQQGDTLHTVWTDVQAGASGGTITIPVRKGETWVGFISLSGLPDNYDISWLPLTP